MGAEHQIHMAVGLLHPLGHPLLLGREPGEAEADGEGRQTMRTLARNMTFLMRSIALGKERFGLPEKETRIATHFIR
jgi:hypothetical protein